MTAEDIARILDGHKVGACWMARCPAHDDHDPSLSILETAEGKVLVRCHAGCDQHRIIAALKAHGLWSDAGPHRGGMIRSQSRATNALHRGDARRLHMASRIWRATEPAAGTLAETYVRSRGIVIPLPAALRFHPAMKHPGGQVWPAMVALVTRGADGSPLAIHRTFLTRDGQGKAPIAPSKMMLGPCGGGVVRLGPISDRLMIAEGIETALSAMQATRQAAWAALSASGLRTLELPADVRDVIVLADGDDPGETAARDCACRWKREGRRVRIARPPEGMDFNDLLVGGAPSMQADAR
jgi:putative DNA primase/helicase